jgi:hypothetical protein
VEGERPTSKRNPRNSKPGKIWCFQHEATKRGFLELNCKKGKKKKM